MKICINRKSEQGAVSLFVVVFTSLLISVVTVSFIQLMIRDQQQSTASDLSQSAYDAAQAGVEDAKRLLLLNQACNGSTVGICGQYAAVLAANKCSTLADALLVTETSGETLVQQDAVNDKKLDEAYTCVKIQLNTDDYKIKNLPVNDTSLIPLKGTAPFNTVKISWFNRDNAPSGAINFVTPVGTLPPVGASWGAAVPALLRTQYISTGTTFNFDDFDTDTKRASTFFLYPATAGASSLQLDLDGRRSGSGAPQPVQCQTSVSAGNYACSVTLDLQGYVAANATSLLRLSALYNNTSLAIQLFDGTTKVQFAGVQPSIDSTGRANDRFRRVEARVTLNQPFPYPEAAVDVKNNLCKNFTVTTNTYTGSGCDPATH